MAIKNYEAGTRFNPKLYIIALGAHDEIEPENSAFAIGLAVKVGADTVKLQSPVISIADCTPVTDFGFENYE